MPQLFSTWLTVSGCEKFLAHEKRGCALCADRPLCCVYIYVLSWHSWDCFLLFRRLVVQQLLVHLLLSHRTPRSQHGSFTSFSRVAHLATKFLAYRLLLRPHRVCVEVFPSCCFPCQSERVQTQQLRNILHGI